MYKSLFIQCRGALFSVILLFLLVRVPSSLASPLKQNGEICKKPNECSSGICLLGPVATKYCVSSAARCAKPNSDGVQYGAVYVFNGLAYGCVPETGIAKINSNSCALQPEDSQRIHERFDLFANKFISSNLPSSSSGSAMLNPNILYNMQQFTASTLAMADYCQDDLMLDKLSSFYSRAFLYLATNPQGASYWRDPSAPQYEVPLYSTQFLYALTRQLRNLSRVPKSKMTPHESQFFAEGKEVVRSHLDRWMNSKAMWIWSSCGSPTTNPRLAYSFPEYVTKKFQRQLGVSANAPYYCNAITEHELWVAAAAVEFLSAADAKGSGLKIDATLRGTLISFVQKTQQLFESRLTHQGAPGSRCGQNCDTLQFDIGAWYGHPDYPSAIWGESHQEAWDISHARRLVQFLETTYSSPKYSKPVLDGKQVLKLFSNSIAYLVFQGEWSDPRFNNFLNGLNYAYRSYGPSGLSSSYPASGFSSWWVYNADINQLNEVLRPIVEFQSLVSNSTVASSDSFEFLSSLAKNPRTVLQ